MHLEINQVKVAQKTFVVAGDASYMFNPGDLLEVTGSIGNNGTYTIATVSVVNGMSDIKVIESIPSSDSVGRILGGIYSIRYYDTAKAPIVVTPYERDNSTSFTFHGKATLNYGEKQQTDLLNLLENFAGDTPPQNPTEGQIWFKRGEKAIRLYMNGAWSPDVNVEEGRVTFADDAHPSPTARYFIRGNDGLTIGVTTNPSSGASLFSVTNASGDIIFDVEHDGITSSTNSFLCTSLDPSDFNGKVEVNTAGVGTIGLEATRDLKVISGDVLIDSGRKVRSLAGGSLTLNTNVVLQGSVAASNVVINATTGDEIVRFANSITTFSNTVTSPKFQGPLVQFDAGTVTTLNSTTATIVNLTATEIGVTELVGATATIQDLNVPTAADIATLTAAHSTLTTLESTSATIDTLNVTNNTTTNLTVTAESNLATLTATDISSPVATFTSAEITTLGVENATIETSNLTTATITTANIVNSNTTGVATASKLTVSDTATIGELVATVAEVGILEVLNSGTIPTVSASPKSLVNKEYVDASDNAIIDTVSALQTISKTHETSGPAIALNNNRKGTLIIVNNQPTMGGEPEETQPAEPSIVSMQPVSETAWIVGDMVQVCNIGEGSVTLAGAGNVTLLSASGLSIAKNAVVTLRMISPDTWIVFGH